MLRYCAEGNLYSVLEEWLFILKKSSNAKDDDEVLVKKVEEICNKLTSYEGSTVHVQTYETIRDGNDGYEGKCSFAEQYVGDMSDNGGGNLNEDQLKISGVFSSPMWPMILFAGRGAQEGVDFHEYSSKIMHLTLPRGAVSYEQRNGRIDRYRSLLVRRRVAEYFENYAIKESDGKKDASQLLERMFAKASEMQKELGQERDKIYPNWHFNVLENSRWHFEEYIPMWDYTYEKADIMKYDEMYKSFRGSLGMSANMKGDEGIDLSAWNDEK